MDYGHWNIEAVGAFDPADYVGFIYEIEELATGRQYIGRKIFKFKRKKTKSNPSRTKDSDWPTYCSSCEPLLEAIDTQGEDKFAFRIILLCTGKCMLNYEEESIQRERDVLRAKLPNGERKYFNRTIGYKNFAGLEKQTEQAKEKNRIAHLGKPAPWAVERNQRPISDETRENMRLGAMGKVVSDIARGRMSDAHKGKLQSPEWIAKRLTKAAETIKQRLPSTATCHPDKPMHDCESGLCQSCYGKKRYRESFAPPF